MLGLDSPLFDPETALSDFQSAPAFNGVTPAVEHFNKFCILLQSLAADDVGYAVASGVTVAYLNVAHEDDQYARALIGENTCLGTRATGEARILWKQSGTGYKWAIVRIGAGGTALEGAKCVTASAQWTDGSATAVIQQWDNNIGEWVNSDPVTICMPPWLTSWVIAPGTSWRLKTMHSLIPGLC